MSNVFTNNKRKEIPSVVKESPQMALRYTLMSYVEGVFSDERRLQLIMGWRIERGLFASIAQCPSTPEFRAPEAYR